MKRKLKRFVALAEEGKLRCDGCRRLLLLENLEPLQLAECENCGAFNFVPLKIADFWLFEPLGGGGMGSVYKACRRRSPEDVVAIKILRRSSLQDTERRDALFREARIAAEIGDHPLLAKCLDWGSQGYECFVVLEYIEGERLDQRIEREGSLPENIVAAIAVNILDAEMHIYNKGYLYRDLKPANIFITPEGEAKLFDFGLCVTIEEAQHPEGDYCPGSPPYVPPERLWGEPEDAYSEIYSLGLVMYRALTGQFLYQARETDRMIKRHTSQLHLSFQKKLEGFKPELRDIMEKMLEQDAARRYQSFAEVKHDLEEIAA